MCSSDAGCQRVTGSWPSGREVKARGGCQKSQTGMKTHQLGLQRICDRLQVDDPDLPLLPDAVRPRDGLQIPAKTA